MCAGELSENGKRRLRSAARAMLGEPHGLFTDARHYQIVALACLLSYSLLGLDYGAKRLPSALAISASLATQFVCSRCFGLPHIDLRSPLITGFSLSLLLRADEVWMHALAGVIAIGSKFLLRIDQKHVFNPAGFAIVVLLLTVNGVWISSGQWGASIWFAALLGFFAILVLSAARRSDMAIFFLFCHGAFLLVRALWLGDPLVIPLHQMQSGSLLIFAFFMISDPKTSPDTRLGRFVFAFAVAAVAHFLAFHMQMRPALYFALIGMSPLIFLIDRVLLAERFAWRAPAPHGASR